MSLEISNREAFLQLYQQNPQAWKDTSTKFVMRTQEAVFGGTAISRVLSEGAGLVFSERFRMLLVDEEVSRDASIPEIAKCRVAYIRKWVEEAVQDSELKDPLAQKALAHIQGKSDKGQFREQLISPHLQKLIDKIPSGIFRTEHDKELHRQDKRIVKLQNEITQLQHDLKTTLTFDVAELDAAVDAIPNNESDRVKTKKQKIKEFLPKLSDPNMLELLQPLLQAKVFDNLPMPKDDKQSKALEQLFSTLKAFVTPDSSYQLKKQQLAGKEAELKALKPTATEESAPQKPAEAATPTPAPAPAPAPQKPAEAATPTPAPAPQKPAEAAAPAPAPAAPQRPADATTPAPAPAAPQKPAEAATPTPEPTPTPVAPQKSVEVATPTPEPTPAPVAPQSPEPTPSSQTPASGAPEKPAQASAPEAKPELKWYEKIVVAFITFVANAYTVLRRLVNKIRS